MSQDDRVKYINTTSTLDVHCHSFQRRLHLYATSSHRLTVVCLMGQLSYSNILFEILVLVVGGWKCALIRFISSYLAKFKTLICLNLASIGIRLFCHLFCRTTLSWPLWCGFSLLTLRHSTLYFPQPCFYWHLIILLSDWWNNPEMIVMIGLYTWSLNLFNINYFMAMCQIDIRGYCLFINIWRVPCPPPRPTCPQIIETRWDFL